MPLSLALPGLAFFPWFQTREDGSEVGLIRACHNTEAADRGESFDAFRFPQDLFHLRQHRAGAFQRSGGRKLNVDTQTAPGLLPE